MDEVENARASGRVSGKVALVSGGARGMGASHARLLVAEGASVIIGDVLDEDGERLADELGAAARFVHLDVTDYEQWADAVETVKGAFGRLDVLVNNAGIVHFAPIDEYPLEAWDRVLAVNLSGAFYGIRAAVPAMKATGGGSIVNISSTAGLQGFGELHSYAASKFGVRGLTKSAAMDLGPHRIRVNSVHPGDIRTPMTTGIDESPVHVALRRIGEPIEVSYVVLYLASDESAFTTGAEFVVDGGETAGRAA